MNTIKEVVEYLKTKKNVFLYGAGEIAKRMEKQFTKRGVNVSGYIVTERGENPRMLHGKTVMTRDEFLAKEIDFAEYAIVVAFRCDKKGLANDLSECGLRNVVFPKNRVYDSLLLQERCNTYNALQTDYYIDIDRKDMEIVQGALTERKTGVPFFRIPVYHENVVSAVQEYCLKSEYEREYGELRILPHESKAYISCEKGQEYGIEMYVITTHFDTADVEDIKKTGFIPLQVGAALTDIRKGCLTDDIGDNISKKNRNYSECTGLYWIWKNTKNQKYVGLCHYRRRLELDNQMISVLEKENIGAVLPLPQFSVDTMQEFFPIYISKQDWELLKNAVIEYDSVYESIFCEHEHSHFYFPCNIFLMQRSWFDAYCEFAFWVADQVEAEYRRQGIVREDRYMGYLFENMTSLFIKRHYKEMNVACSEIEWVSF